MIVSCPSCGNGNPPWARQCTRCGEPLDGQSARAPAARYKVTVRQATQADTEIGQSSERLAGQQPRPPVSVPPKLREVRRPIDTMERDPNTGVPIPPARLPNAPTRSVTAAPEPAPSPSPDPAHEPEPTTPAPTPPAPSRIAVPAAPASSSASTQATPARPPAPAPTSSRTVDSPQAVTPRTPAPAADLLARLAPPQSAEPRLPPDFRFPEQPAPRLPDSRVAATEPAEPRLPTLDADPALANPIGTTPTLPGFDDTPALLAPDSGKETGHGRASKPQEPTKNRQGKPDDRTGARPGARTDTRADDEPTLPAADLPHFDEDPRIGLHDGRQEQRSPPSAALVLPVPNRTVRNLLAAVAVLAVVAIGIAAFIAVVQTAPGNPQQESTIDRLAARAIERLESWGLR